MHTRDFMFKLKSHSIGFKSNSLFFVESSVRKLSNVNFIRLRLNISDISFLPSTICCLESYYCITIHWCVTLSSYYCFACKMSISLSTTLYHLVCSNALYFFVAIFNI